MRRLFAGGLVVLSGAFAMAACVVDESFPEGQFRCDPKGGSDECPPGLVCTPAGVCRHSALTPNDGGGEACFPLDCPAQAPSCGILTNKCGATLRCECPDPLYTCNGNPNNLGRCDCSKHQTDLWPPGAGAEFQVSGGVAWIDDSLVYVEVKDGKPATTKEMASGQTSNVLKASAFDFKLPAGVTITGIEVDIDRASTSTDTALTDKSVQLFSGTTNYETKTLPGAWTQAGTVAKYGGLGDLWGAISISTDEVSDRSDFGVALAVSASGSDTPRIDLIQIVVYFDNPACPHE